MIGRQEAIADAINRAVDLGADAMRMAVAGFVVVVVLKVVGFFVRLINRE